MKSKIETFLAMPISTGQPNLAKNNTCDFPCTIDQQFKQYFNFINKAISFTIYSQYIISNLIIKSSTNLTL